MLVLLCAFILTACSSVPDYNEQLQGWVGMSEEHLIDNWGMPDNSFIVDQNTKVVTYVELDKKGRRDAYPNLIDYPAISQPSLPGPDPDRQDIEYCKISFTISGNIVTGYNYNGDDCTGFVLEAQGLN